MDIGKAVGMRIQELCGMHHLTLNKLGAVCGITQSTLNNIVHGGSKNPTVETVRRICLGLDISLRDFFDAPCFALGRDETH